MNGVCITGTTKTVSRSRFIYKGPQRCIFMMVVYKSGLSFLLSGDYVRLGQQIFSWSGSFSLVSQGQSSL